MQPLLTILIPSVIGQKDRNENIDRLGLKVSHQIREEWTVGFLVYYDNKNMTIGEKREYLYSISNGVYSWQIDSDDDISDDAVIKIIEAIKNNPDVDCITFKEKCIIDGVYKSSNFSHKYDGWKDNFDGFDWVRDVFYKCVIKTEIAKKVPFPHIRYNEDQQWGVALKPFIQTEYHIDEEIYYYIHNSSPSHERYGFDKD